MLLIETLVFVELVCLCSLLVENSFDHLYKYMV